MQKPTTFETIVLCVLIFFAVVMLAQQCEIGALNQALIMTADTLKLHNQSIEGLTACIKALSK